MVRRSLFVGFIVLLFTDVARMWAPSLITIFGQAAETPAEYIGGFALACAVVPLLVLLISKSRTGLTTAALGVLLLARIALPFTDGGAPQLWWASVGVSAGIWALALILGNDRHVIAPGIATGIALTTVSHAGLGTFGAVWRDDLWGWGLLVLTVASVVVLWILGGARVAKHAIKPSRRQAIFVFPTLLLTGIFLASAARASTIADDLGLVVVAAASVLAIAATNLPIKRAAVAVAHVVAIASVAALAMWEVEVENIAGVIPTIAILGMLVGLPALMYILAAGVTGPTSGGPIMVALGAIIWVLFLFVYYAGYDLGYRADIVFLGVAAVFGPWAFTSSEAANTKRKAPSRTGMWFIAAGAVFAMGIAYIGPGLTIEKLALKEPGEDSRVVAYNLRMGYGMNGRFVAKEVAQFLADENVDVALLSEIDRGWLLNGGQDQLRILADMLDMYVAFAPASDPVWGDAILSRTPLTDVHNHHFDRYDTSTGAQALIATTTLGGQEVTFISTHLQYGPDGTDATDPQAADLAGLMVKQSKATVMGGDLNTTPSSSAWVRITATGFIDVLAPIRPVYTWPADKPNEEIDHLFFSPGLVGNNPRVVDVQYSDHLPVFIDLAR